MVSVFYWAHYLGMKFFLTFNTKSCLSLCNPMDSLQSFAFNLSQHPTHRSFSMSCLLASGSQSIGVSASLSVLSMNIQSWFPLGLIDLISLESKGLSSVFSITNHNSKASIPWHSAFFIVQLSHPYMTTGKTIALTIWTLFGKVISLLYNMLVPGK